MKMRMLGPAGERRFPCLDGHRYGGCVGLAACWAERCWTGRRLRPDEDGLHADSFDRPLKVVRYTASDCPNCAHAVDLHPDGELRSTGGRPIAHWTMCELGLWDGPASVYNLVSHRAPVKRPGRCPCFVATLPERMRPELLRLRAADQARARARRARRRGAKVAA